MNPIYVEKEKDVNALNFTLTLVKKPDSSIDNLYIDVKKFCEMKSMSFTVRDFNSTIFEEDCDYIRQLPALHLYMRKKGHIETFYPSDTYQTNIVKLIEKTEYEEEQKKLKKKSVFSYLIRLLK
jgi:hypothetical protein